mgnify:CR=1 FL=1
MNGIYACLVLIMFAGFTRQATAGERLSGASLKAPVGISFDKSGTLYVSEWGAGRLSSFDEKGQQKVVAGTIAKPEGLALAVTGRPSGAY